MFTLLWWLVLIMGRNLDFWYENFLKLTWIFINMQAKNCYFTNFSVTLVQMSQSSKLSAYLRYRKAVVFLWQIEVTPVIRKIKGYRCIDSKLLINWKWIDFSSWTCIVFWMLNICKQRPISVCKYCKTGFYVGLGIIFYWWNKSTVQFQTRNVLHVYQALYVAVRLISPLRSDQWLDLKLHLYMGGLIRLLYHTLLMTSTQGGVRFLHGYLYRRFRTNEKKKQSDGPSFWWQNYKC